MVYSGNMNKNEVEIRLAELHQYVNMNNSLDIRPIITVYETNT